MPSERRGLVHRAKQNIKLLQIYVEIKKYETRKSKIPNCSSYHQNLNESSTHKDHVRYHISENCRKWTMSAIISIVLCHQHLSQSWIKCGVGSQRNAYMQCILCIYAHSAESIFSGQKVTSFRERVRRKERYLSSSLSGPLWLSLVHCGSPSGSL